MATDQKLQALQKSYALEEQKTLEAKSRVEKVFDERRDAFLEAEQKRDKLKHALHELRTTGRADALRDGNAQQLGAIVRYEKRLENELSVAERLLKEKEEDLNRAKKRLDIAETELVQAKIAKKKVEKFLDNRARAERILDSAIEEALTDEMNTYRRGRS